MQDLFFKNQILTFFYNTLGLPAVTLRKTGHPEDAFKILKH